MPNGVIVCAMSPILHIKIVVENCKVYIAEHLGGKNRLPKMAGNPFAGKYVSKLETSPDLQPEGCLIFQSLIGVMRWTVELGHGCYNQGLDDDVIVGIGQGVSWRLLHVMAYLCQNYNSRLAYDLTYLEIDCSQFK